MNKILLTVLCGILLTINTQAQTWNYPDATFPSGMDVCDDTPWKLVFYDGFDGTSLSGQWHKFSSNWSGVPDSEDWELSHGIREANHLYKKENVIVGNGICRLLVKNEHYTWQCPSCTPAASITRNFTSGYIETPFHFPSSAPFDEDTLINWYNSGKFEARIKFPTFPGAWSCFWLFNGYGKVNEIDIAEAYGDKSNGWPYWLAMPNVGHVNNTLHAWGPQFPDPNPYNLPGNATNQNRYPGQTWWDFYNFNNFRIGDWHTYRCEWDTAVLRFYIDNDLKNTIWKYYRDEHYGYWQSGVYYNYNFVVGSGCNPGPGTWKVTYAFPYDNNSHSNIRLDAWIDDSRTGNPNSVYELGEMQVDYVAAWQRHLDGAHEDLCHLNQEPVLSGGLSLCDSVTLTATPAIPGAIWSASGQVSLFSNWTSGNTDYATFESAGTSSFPAGYAYYHYGTAQEGCPPLIKQHYLHCSVHKMPFTMLVNTHINGYRQFQLFVPEDIQLHDDGNQYIWEVDYTTNSGSCESGQSLHEQLFGRFVSTRYVESDTGMPYCIRWQLKVAYPEGDTVSWQGQRDDQTAYGQQNEDTAVFYLDANITDSVAYQSNVQAQVARTMMPYGADTLAIRSMIEKVRAQELAPYLIMPDSERSISYTVPAPRITGDTRVFPNPASDLLHIVPGTRFNDKEKLSLRIYDLPGRLQQSCKKSYLAGQAVAIPVGSLKEGAYILELQQGACKEHYKFIRSSK